MKEELLDNLSIAAIHDMWIQMDGSRPLANMAESLYAEYPDKWIGRNGVVNWLPKRADITPLDFFLWGYHWSTNISCSKC